MSRPSPSRGAARPRSHAPVFAALGDETRLKLLTRLGKGQPHSISQLTEGSGLTRQAIAKHLRVLEGARLVHGVRTGRESRFELDPRPLAEVRQYLDAVSERWDQALSRLKRFVED